MSQCEVRDSELDGLLACFRIFGYSVVDPETIASTYSNEPERVVCWFDEAEDRELIRHVSGSMYELTPEGEDRLEEILFRCGSSAIASD